VQQLSELVRPEASEAQRASTLTEALIGVVAPLHEAPQDPAVWTRAFGELSRLIPCEQGALVERLGRSVSSNLGLVVGTDPRFLGEYQREFHRIDPFASDEVVARLHDLGRAALSGEVLQDVELQRSPFYNQFLCRYGDLFHGVGGSFQIADQTHAHIWLLRSRGHAFEESERRRMDVFFAHARAALRQRRWLQRMERERDAALAWMDCWSDATFVMDAHGVLMIANVTAERLLRRGDVLTLRNGRLRPGKSGDIDWLAPLLVELVKEARQRGEATRCLALPRRPGTTPLHAILTTLPETPGRSGDGGPPRITLVLRDLREALPQFAPQQLKDLFGFTAAESRVANALLAGQSVEDISVAASVRRDTVRAHVKRMLAKTGSRRQSDLQKLLVKALPNLRSLHARARGDEA
jgi:DNA-binding CsgD family transcriptional regulator